MFLLHHILFALVKGALLAHKLARAPSTSVRSSHSIAALLSYPGYDVTSEIISIFGLWLSVWQKLC